jgi:DNA-binding response OmpR family regulator
MPAITTSVSGPWQVPGRALRVLVVDDNRDTVITLRALLEHEGYETRGAHDARSALREVAQFDPDVLISDLAMPGESGWAIARSMRTANGAAPPGRPVMIAISGEYTKGSDRILTQMSGFNHFLSKPFDTNVLLALLAPLTTPPE